MEDLLKNEEFENKNFIEEQRQGILLHKTDLTFEFGYGFVESMFEYLMNKSWSNYMERGFLWIDDIDEYLCMLGEKE